MVGVRAFAAWVGVDVGGMPCAPSICTALRLGLLVARDHIIFVHAPLGFKLAVITFIAPFFVIKPFARQ